MYYSTIRNQRSASNWERLTEAYPVTRFSAARCCAHGNSITHADLVVRDGNQIAVHVLMAGC